MKRALVASILIASCGGSGVSTQDPTQASVTALDAAPSSPRAAAERALKGKDFTLYAERESPMGYHETFQQTMNGLPVVDAYYQVHLQKDLGVSHVVDQGKSAPRLLKAETIVNDEDAIAIATQAVGGPALMVAGSADKMMLVEEGVGRSVWAVTLQSRVPFAVWEVLVATDDGSVLSQKNRAQSASGTGMVYLPNPVDTSGKFDLADNNDADSAALTAERKQVVLTDLDGTGTLTGKYATTTVRGTRAKNARLSFDYSRSNDGFEETMAYYHITAMQYYIQSLGFANINNRQITANINMIEDDNSFYSPAAKDITFGTGGVDDAEDATIIYHESGHAIQDNQVPGWGRTEEGGAMGEGFGDYWAASNFNLVVSNPFVGTWDATSYNPGTPAFLRRLDTPKNYPSGMDGEVHDDGEIWSACLWQLWGLVGKAKADTLVLQAHFLLTPTAKFADGANAIIKANATLYQGEDAAAIKQIFVTRGILR